VAATVENFPMRNNRVGGIRDKFLLSITVLEPIGYSQPDSSKGTGFSLTQDWYTLH